MKTVFKKFIVFVLNTVDFIIKNEQDIVDVKVYFKGSLVWERRFDLLK